MPLHDYQCGTCGWIETDVYRPAHQGAQFDPPIHCESPMHWIPQIGRLSVFHESEKFTTTVDDPASPTGQREVTIDSLAQIRQLERESEVAARNGEGRRMVWRDYSQDRSNRDQHTIMADPSLPVPKRYSNGTPVRVRRGAAVIADHGSLEDLDG